MRNTHILYKPHYIKLSYNYDDSINLIMCIYFSKFDYLVY